jgi:hypothetical protein
MHLRAVRRIRQLDTYEKHLITVNMVVPRGYTIENLLAFRSYLTLAPIADVRTAIATHVTTQSHL